MDLVVISFKYPFSCQCGCSKTLHFPHHWSWSMYPRNSHTISFLQGFCRAWPWIQLTNSCMDFRLNELMWCLMSELETSTDPGVSVEISFPGRVTEICVYHMWREAFLKWNFKWYHLKTRDKHSITLIQEVKEEVLWERLTIAVEEKWRRKYILLSQGRDYNRERSI